MAGPSWSPGSSYKARSEPAFGYVKISAAEGTEIRSGTIFCTAATETGPSIEYSATEDVVVGSEGSALVPVSAVEAGVGSNVAANTVVLMAVPDKNVTEINNPEQIKGGTERETDDDSTTELLQSIATV